MSTFGKPPNDVVKLEYKLKEQGKYLVKFNQWYQCACVFFG